MFQSSIVFFLVVFGLTALVIASFLLLRRGWLWIWLKATFAMGLVACTVAVVFSLLDILSYQQLLEEVPIASISIYEKQPQLFDLTLIGTDGKERRFEIRGDQWQLDARLLTWVGPIAALGKAPLYRLDRISGRYITLEQALNAEQSIYGLAQSNAIDVWQVLQTLPSWVDANYGSAVYMPMENGAVYSVHLNAKGMSVRAVNSIAKKLIGEDW